MRNSFILLLITGFTVITISKIHAQCNAGTSRRIDICDLSAPEAPGGLINLFQLIGSPTPGGLWSVDTENSGLDHNTGLLNILAIKNSGRHVYTYTITCPDGSVNTASVTLFLGSYIGQGNNGAACIDNSSVNLFHFLTGNFNPHNNGTWSSTDAHHAINDNIFDATRVPVNGTYHFTYSLMAVENCPEKNTSFTLRVHRSPNPGRLNNSRINQPFCETDDLSIYTNVNLFDLIDNEDPGGRWHDDSHTGQLVNNSDSTINLPEILADHGPGTYEFRYEVHPDNRVCGTKDVTVQIVFEYKIDLSNASLTIDPAICIDQIEETDFQATLVQGRKPVPDGIYIIRYTAGSTAAKTLTITFENGESEFIIDKRDLSVSHRIVRIISIISNDNNNSVCDSTVDNLQTSLVINPAPDTMEDTTLSAASVCLGELLTIRSTNSRLLDGEYIFTYTLTGSNQTTGATTEAVRVTNGRFSFTIPDALVPQPGRTTITITRIENAVTHCSVIASNKATTSFTIYKPIDFTAAEISVTTNICLQPGFQIVAKINQPKNADPVPNGTYTVTYTINGSNSFTATVIFKNKKTSFPVDRSQIDPNNPGTYIFNISSIKEENIYNRCENPITNTPLEIKTYKTPDIEGLVMNVNLDCVDGEPYETVTVNLTGASKLTNSTYEITYNLSGKNVIKNKVATLTVINGSASFQIDPGIIPNIGKTTLTLTNIKKEGAECSKNIPNTFTFQFETHKTVTIKKILLTVNDNGINCQDSHLNVVLSGLNILTNITLTYTVSGANIIADQTLTLAVSGGVTGFTIDSSLLPNTGRMILTIVTIQDNTAFCPTVFPVIPKKEITIFEKPKAPIVPGITTQYCGHERRTLNDLNTIIGNLNPGSHAFLWFDNVSGTTPLPINTLLTQRVYWVANESREGCISEKEAVNIIIHQVATPSLLPDGQNFCGLDKPKVSDLDERVQAKEEVRWFDAESGGNLIVKTELLQDRYTYYGFIFSEDTQCLSDRPLVVTVSLTNCNAEDNDFFIPDGFSPDGNGINDTFKIPKIGYIYPNFTLEIFNRNGNILYKGNKNTPPWDGRNTYSNSMGSGIVPNGVYFYTLYYNNKENKPPKQGYLYLNR